MLESPAISSPPVMRSVVGPAWDFQMKTTKTSLLSQCSLMQMKSFSCSAFLVFTEEWIWVVADRAFVLAKDLSIASKIAGSDAIFKTALMFFYERIWARIDWGKEYEIEFSI